MRVCGGIYVPKVSIPLEGKVPLGDKGGCIPPCSCDNSLSLAGDTLFGSDLPCLSVELFQQALCLFRVVGAQDALGQARQIAEFALEHLLLDREQIGRMH